VAALILHDAINIKSRVNIEMSVVIHESRPNINLLSRLDATQKKTLKKQYGDRNVFLGEKKRLWNNYVQTRRAERNRHKLSNASNNDNNNVYDLRTLSLSGPQWAVQVGNTAALETVPRNLQRHRNRKSPGRRRR
jgi:hypothetical protein